MSKVSTGSGNGLVLSGNQLIAMSGTCNETVMALQWRHNKRDGISNERRLECLHKWLFRCRSKKTSKLCVIGLCEGNPPVTGGFPLKLASNAENVSIWWCQHGITPNNNNNYEICFIVVNPALFTERECDNIIFKPYLQCLFYFYNVLVV